jgi:hypothetical protein
MASILRILLTLAVLAASVTSASAGITRLEIVRTEPFAGGQEFDGVGAYVKIVGVAHGELDPAAAANRGVVNLDRAPRNARGLVEYAVDFYVMRPADPLKGNRTLLYEVTNRGRKLLLNWLHDAADTSPGAVNEPTSPEHAGNGFVFRRGYTLVWSGWDPDAPATNGGLRIRVPVATNAGAPDPRRVRVRHAAAGDVADGAAVVRGGHARSIPGASDRAGARSRRRGGDRRHRLGVQDSTRHRARPRRHRVQAGVHL